MEEIPKRASQKITLMYVVIQISIDQQPTDRIVVCRVAEIREAL